MKLFHIDKDHEKTSHNGWTFYGAEESLALDFYYFEEGDSLRISYQ
jgi:hypothetical protein